MLTGLRKGALVSADPTTTRGEAALPPAHGPAWHREQTLLASGATSPRRRARALGVSIERYLAWAYPGYTPRPLAAEGTGRQLRSRKRRASPRRPARRRAG